MAGHSLAIQSQRSALVIGNGAYLSGPLKNSVNDANDMASALEAVGFSVVLKTNADRRTMKEAIREFGRRLRSSGVGLFYYAGHGLQVKGRNYFIPIDAQIETESEVEYEAVDAGRVLGQMEDAGNGLNIVILDACRNNPFSRSFRSPQRGLAVMNAPEGTILAYATAPGNVAADGDGRNGLYTAKLLKHMQTPGLAIELFFKQVRREVRHASAKQQVPWTESSLIGDFYFKPKSGKALAVERKRFATEEESPISKQTPSHDYADPEVVGTQVVDREQRYHKYSSGVIFDTKTGLEWYVGPDTRMGWYRAKSWILSLSAAGGGWRIPKIDELRTLYQKDFGARNLSPFFKMTGRYVWSGDDGRTSGFTLLFDFVRGEAEDRDGWERDYTRLGRSFAVRTRR